MFLPYMTGGLKLIKTEQLSFKMANYIQNWEVLNIYELQWFD